MISVIIPYFNQPEYLRTCLAALMPQISDGWQAEVILVDNASTVGPQAVLRDFPAVKLLHEGEPGPGPARTLGARHAKGEVLAFVDTDCVVAPNWLAEIARVFADKSVQIAGGEVFILHKDTAHPTGFEAYESEFAFRQEFYVKRDHYSATCNLIVRREVMAKVGPFGGIKIAEDRDWGHRAHAMGLPISWAPSIIVYHPARDTFAELARKWDRLTGHAFEMQARGLAGRIKWGIKALAMAVSAPAALPRILRSDRIRGGIGAKVRAFAVLVRIRHYRAKLMLRLLLSGGAGEKAGRWRDQG